MAACGALVLGSCGNENLGGGARGGPGTDGAGVPATGGMIGVRGSGGVIGAGGFAVGGAAGHGAGVVSGAGGCNAISLYPPIVTVVDATSGAPICDATFITVSSSESNASDPFAVACDGTTTTPCPPALAVTSGGGAAVCRFELEAFTTGPGEIQVGAPGYLTSAPFAVYSGKGGCVPYVAASELTIALTPEVGGAAADAQAAADAH